MGGNTSYELTLFGSGQYEMFADMLRQCASPPDEQTVARWRWWCFSNPEGGAFAAIKHGKDIVATCYLAAKRLNIDGKHVAAYEIGEASTVEAHQRKGLFSRLARACIDYALQGQASLVYGTPNRRAVLGWRKLELEILVEPSSWLLLAVNPAYVLAKTTSIFRAAAKRPTVGEISAQDYIDRTKAFARLNAADHGYLAWRFATGPFAYRFFALESRGRVFLCALRYGGLGRFPVLVCSEAFLDGRKPERAAAVRWLRLTARRFFDSGSYAGIYFHAHKPDGLSAAWLLLNGVVSHRELPICAKYADPASAKPDWFKHFQLSDCDIG